MNFNVLSNNRDDFIHTFNSDGTIAAVAATATPSNTLPFGNAHSHIDTTTVQFYRKWIGRIELVWVELLFGPILCVSSLFCAFGHLNACEFSWSGFRKVAPTAIVIIQKAIFPCDNGSSGLLLLFLLLLVPPRAPPPIIHTHKKMDTEFSISIAAIDVISQCLICLICVHIRTHARIHTQTQLDFGWYFSILKFLRQLSAIWLAHQNNTILCKYIYSNGKPTPMKWLQPPLSVCKPCKNWILAACVYKPIVYNLNSRSSLH